MGVEILSIPEDYLEEFCELVQKVLADEKYPVSQGLRDGLGGWVKNMMSE